MYKNSDFVRWSLQNVVILHFFERIFARIKKKQYLCTVKLKTRSKVVLHTRD